MKKSALVIMLATTLSVSAQDWEWEQQDINIWNPTNFPNNFRCIGDFNGDGSPDLLKRNYNNGDFFVYEFVGDPDHLRWEAAEGVHDFEGDPESKHYAVDLDDDAIDEVIIWNWGDPICWKVASTEPWSWESCDSLLDEPFLPDTAAEAIWGDFDGDGFLNAFFIDEDAWEEYDPATMYEWDETGNWIVDLVIPDSDEWGFFTGAFEGDYDQDGDLDCALEFSIWDSNPQYFYFLNEEGSLSGPIDSLLNTHPVGGDLDGDGDWDFMGGYSIDGVSLNTFTGQVIGRVNTEAGEQIAGIYGCLNYDWFMGYWGYSGVRYYTENGWAGTTLGLSTGSLYYSVSSEDMNGDQQVDLLAVSISPYVFNLPPHQQPNPSWDLYLNSEDPNEDHFTWSGVSFESMAQNEDTVFTKPQIGNIRESNHRELFVFAEVDSSRQLLIYEFQQPGGAESLILRSGWTNGLPESLSNFRLADIDNDGQSELFSYLVSSEQWSVYFHRFGTWHNYDILPEIGNSSIALVDFDGDGDLDIAGSESVWLSLNPSPAVDEDILLPSAYRLTAYPNPFNPETSLRLSVPMAGRAAVDVYDIRGRLVERLFDGVLTVGEHTMLFDGTGLPSGVYFAKVSGDFNHAVQKLVLLR